MPNAAASRAKKLFATRWDDDELDEVEVDPEEVGVPPVPSAAAELGTGVPVATAPRPPVTGPLSEICESLREDDERLGSLRKQGSNTRVLRSNQGPWQRLTTRRRYFQWRVR